VNKSLALGGIASAKDGERLCFSLPSLPVSCNRLYTVDHNRRRVFLSDEALLWRTHMAPSILPCRLKFETYKLTLSYQSPRWLVKSGDLRKIDHSNWDKLVLDTLCSKWGFDDSKLVEVVRRKEWFEYDRIVVTLEEGHRLVEEL
jgi:Holliday junction resolvase RusA-like endonuclease